MRVGTLLLIPAMLASCGGGQHTSFTNYYLVDPLVELTLLPGQSMTSNPPDIGLAEAEARTVPALERLKATGKITAYWTGPRFHYGALLTAPIAEAKPGAAATLVEWWLGNTYASTTQKRLVSVAPRLPPKADDLTKQLHTVGLEVTELYGVLERECAPAEPMCERYTAVYKTRDAERFVGIRHQTVDRVFHFMAPTDSDAPPEKAYQWATDVTVLPKQKVAVRIATVRADSPDAAAALVAEMGLDGSELAIQLLDDRGRKGAYIATVAARLDTELAAARATAGADLPFVVKARAVLAMADAVNRGGGTLSQAQTAAVDDLTKRVAAAAPALHDKAVAEGRVATAALLCAGDGCAADRAKLEDLLARLVPGIKVADKDAVFAAEGWKYFRDRTDLFGSGLNYGEVAAWGARTKAPLTLASKLAPSLKMSSGKSTVTEVRDGEEYVPNPDYAAWQKARSDAEIMRASSRSHAAYLEREGRPSSSSSSWSEQKSVSRTNANGQRETATVVETTRSYSDSQGQSYDAEVASTSNSVADAEAEYQRMQNVPAPPEHIWVVKKNVSVNVTVDTQVWEGDVAQALTLTGAGVDERSAFKVHVYETHDGQYNAYDKYSSKFVTEAEVAEHATTAWQNLHAVGLWIEATVRASARSALDAHLTATASAWGGDERRVEAELLAHFGVRRSPAPPLVGPR